MNKAISLLEKLERQHKLIHYFSERIADRRDPFRTQHSVEKLLKQRVFTLMQGYEDTNDVAQLKKRPPLCRRSRRRAGLTTYFVTV